MNEVLPLVIGLDLGTTSCKAVALDSQDCVVAMASATVDLHTDASGRAEQDANDYWQAASDALRDVVTEVDAARIRAVSISAAMHTLLPINANHQPLGKVRTWADTRATSVVAALRENCDVDALYSETGRPVQALYHPAAMRWMHEHEADRFHEAALFVSLAEFVAHRLTNTWQAGAGLASTTGLMRMEDGQWHHEALSAAGVNRDRLPPISDQPLRLSRDIAEATGLPTDCLILHGGSDGAMANLGAVGVQPGRLVVTLGTSGAVRRVVAKPTLDAQHRTWCYRLLPDRWLAGGAINGGGVVLDWVRQTFYREIADDDAAFDTLLTDAMTVPPGADGLLVLPHHAGERNPWFRTAITGSMHGLTLNHGRRHIARATLEGIAMTLATLLDIVRDLPPALREDDAPVAVTGGVTQHAVWLQLLADVLGTALQPVSLADASAVGAARLGQWSLGLRDSLEPMHADRTSNLQPCPDTYRQYRSVRERFDRLNRPASN